MTDPPAWQWDESKQVGADYNDPAKILHYERTMVRLRAAGALPGIVESLRLGPEHTLIDMGCGPGLFAVYAARLCRRVHAVDVSQAMLDRARRRAGEAGVTNIEFHCDGFLTYVHSDEPADAAVCMTVLHHLPDFWKVVGLRRLASMLKPGARFYLHDVVFAFEPDKYATRFDSMVNYFEENTDPEMARDAEGHLREEFSTFDWILRGIVERAGFRVLSADTDEMLAKYVCERAGGSLF